MTLPGKERTIVSDGENAWHYLLAITGNVYPLPGHFLIHLDRKRLKHRRELVNNL